MHEEASDQLGDLWKDAGSFHRDGLKSSCMFVVLSGLFMRIIFVLFS